MKKRIMAIAMASMMLGASLAVQAETTFEKIGSIQNADLIYDTNLLRIEGSEGYGIATLDGTMLTECIYTSSFETTYGYITAGENNGTLAYKGVFAQDGTVVLPFQYSEIDVLNEHWILGIVLKTATADQYDYTSWTDKDAYYLIDTVDVYYVENNVGTCLTTLTRDGFLEADAYGKYINIQDRESNAINAYDSQFNVVAANLGSTYDTPYEYGDRVTYKENGRQGIKDAEGNIIMEPSFQYISSFYGDYAEVDNGESYGLVNIETGEVVVPAEYEDIKTSYYLPVDGSYSGGGYNAHGYYAVVKDGKVGFVGANGAVTCEPKYADDAVEVAGASLTLTDLEGKMHILAADGVETIIEGYESVYTLEYGAGMFFEVRDADYNTGLIDWHGNEIFGCEYNDIKLTADGKYLLVDIDYENTDIYAITYASETEEVENATEAVSEAATEAGTETASEAEETSAEDNTAVVAMIDSVIALLEKDVAANKAGAVALLNNIASMTADNASVKVLVDNAITLLDAEGGESSADAVISLLDSAKSLL